jgi:hypothetical protein
MMESELASDRKYEPKKTPADWKGVDLSDSTDWIHQLSSDEVLELESALSYAKSRGLSGTQLTVDDFPLPTLARVLDELATELVEGRGFKLLRGFPVLDHSKEDASTIFWGIGTHIGKAWPQDQAGELLGDIRDEGIEITPTNTIRGYQTRITLPFHTDRADFVCLLCLRKAKSGGLSSIVSSVGCHNEMAIKRPDLLDRLYEPFYYDMRGEHPEGGKPFYPAPIFTEHKGRLFNRYVRGYITAAQRFDDVPKLSERDIESLDYLDNLMNDPDMHLSMDLQPGDMQFVNNYTVFHARTEFDDYEELDRKRHLKRLWLTTDHMPDRPAAFVLTSKNRGLV